MQPCPQRKQLRPEERRKLEAREVTSLLHERTQEIEIKPWVRPCGDAYVQCYFQMLESGV